MHNNPKGKKKNRPPTAILSSFPVQEGVSCHEFEEEVFEVDYPSLPEPVKTKTRKETTTDSDNFTYVTKH